MVLVFIVACVELTGVFWTYWTQDRLVYGESRNTNGNAISAFPVPGYFFHPYFGYALSPGRTGEARDKFEGVWQGRAWRVNNAGFAALEANPDLSYPYKAADDEIVVGIFGGSVGTGTALSAQISKVFLQRSPAAWTGKKVTVLNFSVSGYRQPQQLFVFQYFSLIGQRFDAVINIDGFNEVVTSPRNYSENAEWSYPADSLWGAAARQLEAVARRNQDSRSSWLEQGLAASNAALAACRTGICVIRGEIIKSVYRFGPRGGAPAVLDPQETLFPVAMYKKPVDGAELLTNLADLWAESSIRMSAVAERMGAIYIHVLQPNQWDRRFGKYDPIDPNHPFGWIIGPVNAGYQIFRGRIPALRNAGVEVVDASGIFSGQSWRQNYSDDCCHFTAKGYRTLHLAMIEAISAKLSRMGVTK